MAKLMHICSENFYLKNTMLVIKQTKAIEHLIETDRDLCVLEAKQKLIKVEMPLHNQGCV